LKLWFILIEFFNPCHLDDFKDFFTTVGRIIIKATVLPVMHQGFAILRQGSTDIFKEAIAESHPQVLNLTSSMMPRSFTWICKHITTSRGTDHAGPDITDFVV